MEYFGATDIGNHREKNEDSFYAGNNLFIVADGMGGHRAGEIASSIAVETFKKNFSQFINFGDNENIYNKENNQKNKKLNTDIIKKALTSSITEANIAIYKNSISKMEYSGMGTTFTCCYIYNSSAYVIHIGDSRLYIKSNNNLKLLTADHTIVGELYRKGKLTYEQTFNHPQRNYLTKVLGTSYTISPDFFIQELQNEDILLLCSDGLNSMLKDDFILKIIKKFKNTEVIIKKLIDYAKSKGGFDNITIIIIKLCETKI